MPTAIQTAALDYLKAGLHLLALEGKKPNPRVHGDQWSWDDSFHGDPETEAEWEVVGTAFSERRGTTGIAILIPKDFYVADIDTDEAAALWEELGGSVEGVVSKTKNGLHVWLWWPGADRNRWLGQRTLLFKGFGGYVVAPPSLHFGADGKVDGQYEWINPLVEGSTLMLPDTLPAAAAERFEQADKMAELLGKGEHDPTTSWTLVPEAGVPWYLWKKEWDYQTAGLEKAIENAADGNQNNVIHWAALTARDEGVPFEVAMERLLAAAIRGHHPERRARDTIRGAYKRR